MNFRLLLETSNLSTQGNNGGILDVSGTTGVHISNKVVTDRFFPYYHLSQLLRPPLIKSDIILHPKDLRHFLPVLLGAGIECERLFVFKDGAIEKICPKELHNVQRGNDSLCALKDIHKGHRAFIIGNGPSLTMKDLDTLTEEITFASNKIYLAFEQTLWRPSYYTVCDYLVAANNADIINKLECTKIFPTTLSKYNCHGDDIIWYDERFDNKHFDSARKEEQEINDFLFTTDAGYGLQGGYTVIYHQLQLAFYMGIRDIYLIGVDFHFNVPEKKVEDERFASDAYRQALSSSGELNHFHPDYRKLGENWSMPRMDLQEIAFRSSRNCFQRAGGTVRNASRRTELNILEKVDLDKL